MYSPKIKEEYVPLLYQLKQKVKKPMTVLVSEAIAEFLTKHQSLIKENQDEKYPSNR
ncbi:MAG: hypothetical protein QY331_14440 [Melioribacteraceae bacterium]|nr:MAG: hypothetical protein QY331_14440 [Melioribacteraceae bacterium]